MIAAAAALVGGVAAVPAAGAATPPAAAVDIPPQQLRWALPLSAVNRGDVPALDGAAAPGRSEIDPVVAEQILDAAAAAIAGQGGDPGAALTQVAAILPRLNGRQQARGESLIARPTQGAGDPDRNGYTAPASAVFSTNFCVFWVSSGPDAPDLADGNANAIPDYVEFAAQFAEESYAVEHGPLGFRLPLSDGNLGCDGGDGRSRTDIYIKDLNGNYGVAPLGPGQRYRRSSYFLVDEDFAEQGYAANPLAALAVTVAHEYGHVIQAAYDAFQDSWMKESTSTWLEEAVYPAVNDYLNYLGAFAGGVRIPLTSNVGLHRYGAAVWNLYLVRRFGDRVIRDSWAQSLRTSPLEFAPEAYSRGIPGPKGFEQLFVSFAASLPEWRTSGVYPDSASYPDVRRTGTLSYPERFFDVLRLDHATFRLVRVQAPSGRAARLLMIAPRGLSAGMALVGRLPSGEITTVAKGLPRGGRGSVSISRPGRFVRLTAVLVNADISQRGYDNRIGDWRWTRDNARFEAAVFRVP